MRILGNTLLAIFLIGAISCNKEEKQDSVALLYDINGSAQKGPFINGSNITLFELNSQYGQTGKAFMTSTGSLGGFEITGILLESPYAEIVADGFYYNEVLDILTAEKLTLKAITDLSGKENANVNILTHLEYERVKYLILHEQMAIAEAKARAQKEILAVFNLDSLSVARPEDLSIAGTEEGDALLLAVSAIFQGNNTTVELSKLLADFVTDLKEDGILNDTVVQSILLGQAMVLDCNQIHQNLSNKYNEASETLPENLKFKDYIQYFISQTDYTEAPVFNFPSTASHGINLLDPSVTQIQYRKGYSFAVSMPGAGKITLKLKLLEGKGFWAFQPFNVHGWKIGEYANKEQLFTSTLNDEIIDMSIDFFENGKALVEYYYNESDIPAITKIISWGLTKDSDFIFPDESPAGMNLLNTPNGATLASDTAYTVGLLKPGTWQVDFALTWSENMDVEVPSEWGGWGIYEYQKTGNQILFSLKGKDEGDYISEIILKVTGNGQLNLSSGDLEITAGHLLNRSYNIE